MRKRRSSRPWQKAEAACENEVLVRLSPRGWSGVAKEELRTMAAEGKAGANLGSLLPIRRIPDLHPDHPLETALRYVNRWPLVPVVSRLRLSRIRGRDFSARRSGTVPGVRRELTLRSETDLLRQCKICSCKRPLSFGKLFPLHASTYKQSCTHTVDGRG